MKTACCTISANNFLSYGLDCLLSNKKYNNYEYFYLIADEFIGDLYTKYQNEIHFIDLNKIGIDKDILIDLEFKYNIVEFNTSVKPAFYKYLFSLGYENVIYLDPDIESYSCFSYLDDLLTKNNIILTPHKCTDIKSTFFNENAFLNNGIYNLGFIAMHNSETTQKFLNWWDFSLRDACYLDYEKGMATDQIWANLVPIYFDGVYITKHPGMNLAFWNIDERKITKNNNSITINDYELLFIHFSSLSIGCKQELLERIYSIEPNFKYIYEKHIDNIKSYDYEKFSKIQYKFNYYETGDFISKEEKRFYGYSKLNLCYKNPFSNTKKSFYNDMKKNKIKFNNTKTNRKENVIKIFITLLGIRRVVKLSTIFSGFNINYISRLYANLSNNK